MVSVGQYTIAPRDIESAVSFYAQAIKRDPSQAKAYYNLSTSYLFLSLHALHNAEERLRDGDPGKKIIAKLTNDIERLVNQPVQSTASVSKSQPSYELEQLLKKFSK